MCYSPIREPLLYSVGRVQSTLLTREETKAESEMGQQRPMLSCQATRKLLREFGCLSSQRHELPLSAIG